MPQHHHSSAYDFVDDDDDLLKKKRKPPPKAPVFLPTSSTGTSRRILVLVLIIAAACVAVGVSGIAFAAAALRRPPRIVTVFRCGRAEDTLRTFRSKSLAAAGREEEVVAQRPKVLAVVGVYTGFSAADRRAALRGTWFPSDSDALWR